jgi:ethanolamine transporter EutH
MSLALIGMTGIVLAGAWGALWIVNRWRDKPAADS